MSLQLLGAVSIGAADVGLPEALSHYRVNARGVPCEWVRRPGRQRVRQPFSTSSGRETAPVRSPCIGHPPSISPSRPVPASSRSRAVGHRRPHTAQTWNTVSPRMPGFWAKDATPRRRLSRTLLAAPSRPPSSKPAALEDCRSPAPDSGLYVTRQPAAQGEVDVDGRLQVPDR